MPLSIAIFRSCNFQRRLLNSRSIRSKNYNSVLIASDFQSTDISKSLMCIYCNLSICTIKVDKETNCEVTCGCSCVLRKLESRIGEVNNISVGVTTLTREVYRIRESSTRSSGTNCRSTIYGGCKYCRTARIIICGCPSTACPLKVSTDCESTARTATSSTEGDINTLSIIEVEVCGVRCLNNNITNNTSSDLNIACRRCNRCVSCHHIMNGVI